MDSLDSLKQYCCCTTGSLWFRMLATQSRRHKYQMKLELAILNECLLTAELALIVGCWGTAAAAAAVWPACAIDGKCWPRPTSKGKRRKHDFCVTRTLFSQSLYPGHTAIGVVGDRLSSWAAQQPSSRAAGHFQQLHDCYSRIVQEYSDGLTGGAGANLNMRTTYDYPAIRPTTRQYSKDHHKLENCINNENFALIR